MANLEEMFCTTEEQPADNIETPNDINQLSGSIIMLQNNLIDCMNMQKEIQKAIAGLSAEIPENINSANDSLASNITGISKDIEALPVRVSKMSLADVTQLTKNVNNTNEKLEKTIEELKSLETSITSKINQQTHIFNDSINHCTKLIKSVVEFSILVSAFFAAICLWLVKLRYTDWSDWYFLIVMISFLGVTIILAIRHMASDTE